MNWEMVAMFPNGIEALIVDNDTRFIKSSSMLLSLLNYKVTSCGSPTAALKFFSRDKNKDVDVVLINAEKAATCGFDFRGIVETDLGIPVIYFLPRDHVATGDEAIELLLTLGNATYILRSPLEANKVCDLWMVIGWRKCYLENKAKGADNGRRVVPTAVVQAFMASGGSSSTAAVDDETEDNEDRVHFKEVGAGRRCRNRKRKRSCNTTITDSSGTTVARDQTAKRQGTINVTGDEHERDIVSSQQQPATQNAAQPVVSQQQPAAATTIEAIATPPRWNQNQPAADNVVFGNIAPPTGVANMATTVTSELPEFSRGGNQQQLQNICPPPMFGPFPYQGPQPPVLKPAMFVPLRRYSGTESIGGATVVGASAAGAGEYDSAATSLLPTLNLGTEPDGHDDDELAAMMAVYTESNPPVAAEAATEAMYNSSCALMALQRQHIGHGVEANRAEAMDTLNNTNSYINYSAAATVAPQHVGHGVAPNHAAAGQEVLNNGDYFSTYSTSLMAPNNQVLDMASNVNELTMAGGAFFSNANDDASFTAPKVVAAAPNGDQLAQGVMGLDAISASLMASPGPGAGMDGNPGLELEGMFSPDHYDYDNTMFPLEALLGLDDAPVYETGVDYQQQGGAAGGTAADAAGTSLIGGADDNLDILDDYLFMDSTGDFNNGRE